MPTPEPPLELLVDTLTWLVDTPSETGQEGRICTQVAARLLTRFGEPNTRRVQNSLVVGRVTGRPMVLLVGHLDTVPSQGQGPARVADGRLHGLGSTDMKGGLAVMIHLLEDPVVATGPYDVIGIFYEGEEGPADGNGLEPVLVREPWLVDASFAVVLEPSDGEIQMGCNGAINARVVFEGKSAHSARPWFGENAITKAGEWLAELHRREPQVYSIEGLEFREVMSVTRATGGIANNVIPGSFELNLNYRFNPERTREEAERHLRDVCAAADWVEVVDFAPAGPVASDHPFLSALIDASGARRTAKQAWTDVARLSARGIPAVNYGPGETALAHRIDESVELDDLMSVFRALRSVLTAQ